MVRFVPTLLLPLVALATANAQTPLPIRDTTFANGMQIIVIENHAVPLVTVELDVKNGAYTQTPEFEGLAHLYEHMFFKANKAIPSQERYLERLRELGASFNGTTSDERVNYFVTLGSDSLAPAVRFLSDALRTPLFLEDELVRERPVVLGEFDRNEANHFFHLSRAVDTLLWTPGYYSRKNTIGDRNIIITTTPEKMRAIQQLYYVPNNTALILSGDVTPAAGFKLAAEVFGSWPRGNDPFATKIPDPPPLTASKAVIVERPSRASALIMRWHGPSVTTDPAATYAADVLSTIIANPASNFQKNLVDKGLMFSVNLSYYTLSHTGPITAMAQVSPERAVAAEHALVAEIARFTDERYISDAELEAARQQLGIQALYEREQPSEWAHTVGFWWATAGLPYYREYVTSMQKVTKADIARYARQYLIGKPFVAGVMVSPEARQRANLKAEDLLAKDLTP